MKQTKNIIERIEAVGGKFSTAYRKEYEAIPVLKCEFKEENKEDILKKTGGSWIGAGQLGEGKSLVVYYNGEIVFADYLLTDGCYLGSALALFNTASIWSKGFQRIRKAAVYPDLFGILTVIAGKCYGISSVRYAFSARTCTVPGNALFPGAKA